MNSTSGIAIPKRRHRRRGGFNPCPRLGTREQPGLPVGHPSRRNVCYGRKPHWHLLSSRRRGNYRPVSKSRQAELCIGRYMECPRFQQLVRLQEERRKPTARDPAGSGEKEKSLHRRRRKREPGDGVLGRLRSILTAPRWSLPVQLGAATLASAISAFGLYLLLATHPASWFEFVYFTLLRNDIKAFGLKHAGLKEKGREAGLVTGGNLRALKNLSGSAVENLRKSSMVKGLTQKQKQRFKKRYGLK